MDRMSTPPLRLVLFFTRGVSLATWEEVGIIPRETILYHRMAARGVEVTFITHGDRRDLEIARGLPTIRVRCNRWGLPGRLYHRLLPLLNRDVLRGATAIKTQQIPGADLAAEAARRYRRPLIARCGWLWSRNAALEHGPDSPEAERARAAEAAAFGAAARVVVTTAEMHEEIAARLPDVASKLLVIPNYVDTDAFRPPLKRVREPRRIGFVGRLSREKNLETLLDAVQGLDVDLDIIGQGPLEAELRRRAAGNPRVKFVGRIPNENLMYELAKWSAFILPSHFEGHPKVLLEAMACAVPVIASDVPGNRAVVRHGSNGLLCGTDVASLRSTIEGLLSDPDQQERLGRAARQYIADTCSLEVVLRQEMDLLQQLAAAAPQG